MSRPVTTLPPRPPTAPARPAPPSRPPVPTLPPAARRGRQRPHRPSTHTRHLAAIGLLVALTCTSCVLVESKDYLVQPAPPDGIHVTLRHRPTGLLELVSNLVTAGVAIDRALSDRGLRLTCDAYPNTRSSGDRCAFRVLKASRPNGSLVTRTLVAAAWRRALSDGELADFSHDALAQVRSHPGACAHVTIRGLPRPMVANWTWRRAGSRGC